MAQTEVFVQPAGLNHTNCGCILDTEVSLHSRLCIMRPHTHNYDFFFLLELNMLPMDRL